MINTLKDLFLCRMPAHQHPPPHRNPPPVLLTRFIARRPMSIIRKFITCRQERINAANRRRLINHTPTLICSNCTGGVLYHWLGLEFRSPFINLYMDNPDFLSAMEHFDEFIHADITEDTASDKPYPVGVGPRGERIHFMHYPDFATAKAKWIERRQRIDTDNMAVMLTNLGVGTECIGGG